MFNLELHCFRIQKLEIKRTPKFKCMQYCHNKFKIVLLKRLAPAKVLKLVLAYDQLILVPKDSCNVIKLFHMSIGTIVRHQMYFFMISVSYILLTIQNFLITT